MSRPRYQTLWTGRNASLPDTVLLLIIFGFGSGAHRPFLSTDKLGTRLSSTRYPSVTVSPALPPMMSLVLSVWHVDKRSITSSMAVHTLGKFGVNSHRIWIFPNLCPCGTLSFLGHLALHRCLGVPMVLNSRPAMRWLSTLC